MADQSVFSRYPKKHLVFISERLIDEGFDINLYDTNEYDESYNILEEIGKYWNEPINDEDVQFFAKFIEINDSVLTKIFEGDKSLTESLVIPIAKDYDVEYTADGNCYYTEYYSYKVSSYDKGWVDSMIQHQYNDGNFDLYNGKLENTQYDNYEMNEWNIQKVSEIESSIKESLLSKLVLENTQDALSSLDKKTLIKLKSIIDSRLRLL